VPAAAVIPALIAYTKVAAVKKLVVGFWGSYIAAPRFRPWGGYFSSSIRRLVILLTERRRGFGAFTLKKLECSKQAWCNWTY